MYQLPPALLQACLLHRIKPGNVVRKWKVADIPTMDEFTSLDINSQDMLLDYFIARYPYPPKIIARYPCPPKITDNETGINPNKERLAGKRAALYALLGLLPILPFLATIFFLYPNIKKENLAGVITKFFTIVCVFLFVVYKAI